MKKIISLVLLFTFGLSSCEKDDICDPTTPTTPRLVIDFYDIADATLLKKVTNLKVVGIDSKGNDLSEGIIFNENGSTDTKYYANGVSTISIPLKTNDTITSYKFIYNAKSTDPALINTDVLTFYYKHTDTYVSRACGFKTTFVLDPTSTVEPKTSPFVLAEPTQWIRLVNVTDYNIDSENETHLQIYF